MATFVKKIELIPAYSKSVIEYKINEMKKAKQDYRFNACFYYASIVAYSEEHKMLTLIGRAKIGRLSEVTPFLFKKSNSLINKLIDRKS